VFQLFFVLWLFKPCTMTIVFIIYDS
jgi:hypothetical protein